MKKLLPSSSGTLIGDVEAGDYFAYSFSWNYENVYDISQLSAIAWIQNTNTKEVIQACNASQTIEPIFANEAMVSNISNVKQNNCSGEAEPKVLLTNFGSNALTSVELEVLVNGESLKTMTWTGNLAVTESAVVELGKINFPVVEQNTLEVRILGVNGGNDEANSNDIASFSIKGSPDNAGKEIKLTLRTDSNPEETTWKVTNLNTGEVVLEGGPYPDPNTNYNIILEIPEDGCYDFTIFDAGGNGLLGSGLYGLKADGATLFSGKEFGFSESNEFSYEDTVGTEETLDNSVQIFPNPITSLMSIMNEGEQTVTIYNMAGQRVFEGMSNGFLQIDMKRFGSGIYAVKVGETTTRVVVK